MSCHRPVIIYPPCTADCPEPDAVFAQNDNLAGFGTLDRQEGQSLFFRGVSAGEYITVNLDPDTKSIVIDVDPDLISGSFPDATYDVKGKIKLAAWADVISGLNDTDAITPLSLNLVTATVARRGLVELATSIEAQTGSDSERAVTPSALNFVLGSRVETRVFANAAARAAAQGSHVGQIGIQSDTGAIYQAYGLNIGEWDGVNLDAPTISNAINFVGSTWSLNSVLIPANSIVGTTPTAGTPTSYPITDFLGTGSATSSYVIDNALTDRDFDADTVTVAELADVVATLIGDIQSLSRPVLT